eukprot:PhM_4_TR2071/c0_g1_i3/m.47641
MAAFPAIVVMHSYHKATLRYSTGFIVSSNFGLMIAPGVRFCRQVWLVPLVTFGTHIVASSMVDEYWARFEWMQALFWLGNVIPILVLYHVEVGVRTSFVVADRASDALLAIEERTELLKRMLVQSFPLTATHDILLNTQHSELHRTYSGTAMIVSDIVGFTSYT